MKTPSASLARDPLLRRELPGPTLRLARAATLGVAFAMAAVLAHLLPRWLEEREREAAAFADAVPAGILWIANVGAEALSWSPSRSSASPHSSSTFRSRAR